MEEILTRREEKRKRKQQDKGIVDFIMVQRQFWEDLRIWINEMDENFNEETCINMLLQMSGNQKLEGMPQSGC